MYIYIYICVYIYIYIYIYILAIKQILETPFHTIKMFTGFTTDVLWMNTKCAV